MQPDIPKRNHNHSGLRQALLLQDLAAQTADALKVSLSKSKSAKQRVYLARAVRDVVSAWDTARDAVRILRGKGLPTRVPEKPSRSALAARSRWQILDVEDLKPTANSTPLQLPAPTETGKPKEDEPKKESL